LNTGMSCTCHGHLSNEQLAIGGGPYIAVLRDPNPHWILIQQPLGSGSWIRIPNVDPGSGSSGSVLNFFQFLQEVALTHKYLNALILNFKKKFAEDNIWFSSKVLVL